MPSLEPSPPDRVAPPSESSSPHRATVAARAYATFFVVATCVGLAWLGVRLHGRDGDLRPTSVVDVLDGQWARRVDAAIRAEAPFADVLRGHARDVAWAFGSVDERVVVGRRGWLFLAEQFRDPTRVRPARRAAALDDLAARCRAAGVEVVVAVVPDKGRARALDVPAAHRFVGPRAEVLARGRETLAAAGLTVVDLALDDASPAALDGVALWERSDTHWTPAGARVAAVAVADELERRGLERGEDGSVRGRRVDRDAEPDLVRMLGLRPGGPVARSMSRSGYTVQAVAARDATPCTGEVSDAAVAVAGDSFAHRHFADALALALQRRVDSAGAVPGGGPARGLESTLARIERGELASRFVVWVFVERSLLGSGSLWRFTPSRGTPAAPGR